MAAMYNMSSNVLADTNEKKSLYNLVFNNNSNYEERFFNDVMKKCGDWGNDKLENVYNFFVNGSFNGNISSSVNNMVVIGDISDSATVNAKSITVVAPDVDDSTVMNILTREAQRNWNSIDVYLSDSDNKVKDSSRSILLLKTFSKCLAYMKDLNEDEFQRACDSIVESVCNRR